MDKLTRRNGTEGRKPVWAVIGGGNGGQSLAGHLALMGFTVRLYDIIPETVEAIRRQGGIQVNGMVGGFGEVELVTLDMAPAVEGADMVTVVAPAVAHRDIARQCAPHLRDGQIVFIHPGATGGALEFKRILASEGCIADVTLSESNSLIYACRCSKPGQVTIFAIKKELTVAALPANRTSNVVAALNMAFPQIHAGVNVLETSLGNPNAMMHPAPTLLNTSMIESGRPWLYYCDGITPSVGAFVERLDEERRALAARFGLSLPSLLEWYGQAYGVMEPTLSQTVKKNPAYAEVKGQDILKTRYLLEDIPAGLVPMVSLGKMLGVDVPRMEATVKMVELLLEMDLTSTGRTVETMGIAGMTEEEILSYVQGGC